MALVDLPEIVPFGLLVKSHSALEYQPLLT
jgi:hypothetical protein